MECGGEGSKGKGMKWERRRGKGKEGKEVKEWKRVEGDGLKYNGRRENEIEGE